MKITRFLVEVEIPEEDAIEAERDAWRYFWNNVSEQIWESRVTILND